MTRLIKKSNDFGAGGVSVAIGELADSLDIYLDRDGDTWTIDETMWEMELDYLFDVA